MTARETGARRALQREGGPGSGPHAKAVAHVKRQLKGIHPDDMSKAEKNISGHIAKGGNPKEVRNKIGRELSGIDYNDMTTAERNIRNTVGEPSKEAGKGQVAPRYDSSHDEGFVDHRYSDHKGNLGQEAEGGPGSGPHHRETPEASKIRDLAQHTLDKELAKRGMIDTPELKSRGKKEAKKKMKGWTGRQRDMHKEMGERIAMESRRRGPSGPIQVYSDPDHPIDLKSISSRPVIREGWNGGMSYSPPVSRIKKAIQGPDAGVAVKEF
jgi:hypothetical protein